MNINLNTGNSYQYKSINTNSKQYQAAARDTLSAIIAEEMTMTPEERYMYELFGGRERIMKNKMQMYDSEGNMLNAHGIAGMCMNGVSLAEAHQIISVPDEWKEKMFDETKRHFIQEYGVANGDTTKRSEVFQGYQRSTSVENRLKGTWTLGQYEKAYRQAFYDAVKAENPDWKLGKPFDTSILDKISREDIEKSLVKANGEYGTELVSKGIDVSV
ncbi:MAG: DUF3879 family protein [Lachnospiraceae bacterium]|nr:DUF3879 family protein [Lachnospiraceae bacterium]